MKTVCKIALILSISLYTGFSHAEPPSPTDPRLERCDRALKACNTLVVEQDQAITNLKAHVSDLQKRLADTSPPTFPTWAVVITSVAAGLLLGVALK